VCGVEYNAAIQVKELEDLQTCQVLKNFMREVNFFRLVSTRRHHSWRALGEILKFEFPRSPENCLSEVFLPPFSKHKPYVFIYAIKIYVHLMCYKNMKFYLSLLLPKRKKIALLRLRSLPAFTIETHIFKTSQDFWVLALAKRMH
jgi:hypothetical protein